MLATLTVVAVFFDSSRPMTKYEMAVSMCTAVGVHTDHIGANPEAPTGTVLRPRDAQLDMHATHAALLHPTHFPVCSSPFPFLLCSLPCVGLA